MTGAPGGSPPARREDALLAEADNSSNLGALGYVLKDAADSELVEAVRRAAAGDTYLNEPEARGAHRGQPPPGPRTVSTSARSRCCR
jgi:DNA-binding NarL/FixJ family response regulator